MHLDKTHMCSHSCQTIMSRLELVSFKFDNSGSKILLPRYLRSGNWDYQCINSYRCQYSDCIDCEFDAIITISRSFDADFRRNTCKNEICTWLVLLLMSDAVVMLHAFYGDLASSRNVTQKHRLCNAYARSIWRRYRLDADLLWHTPSVQASDCRSRTYITKVTHLTTVYFRSRLKIDPSNQCAVFSILFVLWNHFAVFWFLFTLVFICGAQGKGFFVTPKRSSFLRVNTELL